MKPLSSYITEAVKIIAKGDGYNLVELVERSGIDCPNLTKEEFYDLMMEDLEKAQDEYSRLVYDERKRRIQAEKKRRADDIEKEVMGRYKRKADQDKYRDKLRFKRQLKDWEINQNSIISFDLLTSVSNSHPYYEQGIRAENLKKKLDEGLWDALQDCKWWQQGQGWKICYITDGRGILPSNCNRHEIVISMPDDKMAERKASQEALYNAISAYYDNAGSGGYTGD